MILNYLKVAYRSLWQSKTFSFINIAGLSVGIAASVLIMTIVMHEFSYDRFHANGDRIFRVEKQFSRDGRHSLYANPLFAPALKDVDPRVEDFVRTFDASSRMVSSDDSHIFFQDRLMFADASFFKIFSFPIAQGDSQSLANPSTAIITESDAIKYFGSTNAIGKTITLDKKYQITITAVAKDPPINSSIQFGIVVSFPTLLTMPAERDIVINNSSGFPTYVLLQDKNDLEQVSKSIIVTKYSNPDITYSLSPLFENHFDFNFGSTATTKYAYTFLSIGALILLLALINYMNLTTARSTTRAKEVGVRKIIGAQRSSLSLQFYFESAVTTLISFFIALVLIEISRPLLMDSLGLTLENAFLSSWSLYAGIGLLLVLCALISGSYPAVVLASFRPINVLKGQVMPNAGGGVFRKTLMAFQFSVSVCLAICTVVMTMQLSFLGSFNTGIDRDEILVVNLKSMTSAQRRELKAELGRQTGIENISIASTALYKNNMSGVSLTTSPYNDQKVGVKWMIADKDLVRTLRIDSRFNNAPGGSTYHLLNESAASAFGLTEDSAIRSITMGGDHVPAVSGDISGVIADFSYESLRNPVQPLILSVVPDSTSFIGDNASLYVRLSKGTVVSQAIATVNDIYNTVSDGSPFSYFFLGDAFNSQQLNETRLQNAFIIFSAIALLIACLGLFGVVTFSSERRSKELSIRKILGATAANLVATVSSELLWLLVISIVVAIPAALYFSNQWLSGFYYRTTVTTMHIVVPALSALTIAILVIITQAMKAALGNPVTNLKND